MGGPPWGKDQDQDRNRASDRNHLGQVIPKAEQLIAHWRFTPAETRLALLLLELIPLREAATRLGIGYETARTHLKSLFAKTGTHGRSELIVRLLFTAY